LSQTSTPATRYIVRGPAATVKRGATQCAVGRVCARKDREKYRNQQSKGVYQNSGDIYKTRFHTPREIPPPRERNNPPGRPAEDLLPTASTIHRCLHQRPGPFSRPAVAARRRGTLSLPHRRHSHSSTATAFCLLTASQENIYQYSSGTHALPWSLAFSHFLSLVIG